MTKIYYIILIIIFLCNIRPQIALSYFGDRFIRFARPRDLLKPFFNPANKSSTIIEFATQRLPDAIIIGAKKCGTRALLEFLRLNPKVQAPGPEVHFFDKHFHEGLDWYRRQMPLIGEEQIVLEKSPSYFVNKHVPKRVYNYNPNIKLILVVRDPIIRAISDYTQAHAMRPNSTASQQTFEKLVYCNPSLHKDINRNNCIGHVNISVGPIRIGIYHKHMENWLKIFPLHNIHIVDGENLISNPAYELRAVEEFLDLQPVITADQFIIDANKGFPCVKGAELKPHCLPASKGRHHPSISVELLLRLRHFYSHENEKFFRLLNRRFNWFSI